jgi:ubiquinone biosynthesis protein
LDLWSTAKPFLETWMVEQLGPKKLWEQLKQESPHLVKLLPGLPRLMADYLQRPSLLESTELRALLLAQQRTNRLLSRAALVMGGVLLALVVMQLDAYWGLWG